VVTLQKERLQKNVPSVELLEKNSKLSKEVRR